MTKRILDLIEFARMGGKAKLKKYGRKAYSQMGKKGAVSRWANKAKILEGASPEEIKDIIPNQPK